MRVSKINKNIQRIINLLTLGVIGTFGPIGTVLGECITGTDDPSVFSILINRASNCKSLSGNMHGCEIGYSGTCTISNGSQTIDVTLKNGSLRGKHPLDWGSEGAAGVDFVILHNAWSENSCGFSYTPGSDFGVGLAFLKRNNWYYLKRSRRFKKITRISFCSDFTDPAPAQPRLVVNETVTTENGVCGEDDVEILNVNSGETVKYCYRVENIGPGQAVDVVLRIDNGTPDDPADDQNVLLSGLQDGGLAPGGTATGELLVPITNDGVLVNTATVTGHTFDGIIVSASDTATVNTALAKCPQELQDVVNAASNRFAFLAGFDPVSPETVSVCSPEQDLSNNESLRSVRVSCINECVIKQACKDDPSSIECKTPPVCQPSGAWNYFKGEDPSTFTEENPDPTSGSCVVTSNGQTPFCWEVQQNLPNSPDCERKQIDPLKTGGIDIGQVRANPFVYQSCTNSGGRYVCETICFLFPGEDASVCPSGSRAF